MVSEEALAHTSGGIVVRRFWERSSSVVTTLALFFLVLILVVVVGVLSRVHTISPTGPRRATKNN